ncbi:fungal specific transcription factor domain-containing protein [Aspergillus glaucus CBS 516.65]|uniref:Transcription factor domain-containing protein n=1 Tax=Aspergillus glaucus CBS 516.65 TaxID=1160497 RepID=A0A1L9VKS1_ASPGL|nr:hypothetical protein ASPGLDRAFT_25185 [Aspergillus glaucus CBS 516.65]OJJ84482.1 hypothetical protein ASPGLDRAFT_25185 [Aspergillus glaucus CBS 516.65]
MVQVAQVETVTEAGDDEGHTSKSQLWDLICAADRLLGMILNLSPITSRHQLATTHSVSIDGIVQNQYGSLHICFEAFRRAQGGSPLKPQRSGDQEFLHYYVAMRVHLPLTLRQGPDGEDFFSCLACVDACESLVQLYQFLSRRLPPGLFLSEMLDLQAFTAAATLLLISHMSSSIHFLDMGIDKIKISNEVGQVIKLLHPKPHGTSGSGIAHNGVTTLCSLNDMLRETENGVDLRQIAFHVLLLGKVQTQRTFFAG